MKYLNEQTQFLRVSDEEARHLMESCGYDTPAEAPKSVASHVYMCEGERFILSQEVIEGEDEELYVRLDRLDADMMVEVDDNGRENIVEMVNFDGHEYILEALYFDDDEIPYAHLVYEGAQAGEGDEEEAEATEPEETEDDEPTTEE